MASSDETRTTTEWRTASRLYRRPPNWGWLLALIAIPLLLGAIGYHALPKTHVSAPTVNTPTAGAPTVSPSLPSPNVNTPAANTPAVNTPTVNAPAAGAAGCANLSTDVSGLLQSPITFETDSYTLSAASQQELTQVANRLKSCPTANVSVTGYTDNTGNDAINQPLSENRAKAVADFLSSNGVPADHITSKGVGAASPVAGNDTADGRAQNRHVVIAIT